MSKQKTAILYAAKNGRDVEFFATRPTFGKVTHWSAARGYVNHTEPTGGNYLTSMFARQFKAITGVSLKVGEVKKVRVVVGAKGNTKGTKLSMVSDYWNDVTVKTTKGKEVGNFCTSGFNEALGVDVSVDDLHSEKITLPMAVQVLD